MPGAEYASISAVGKRRDIRTLAATGDLSRAVDRAQSDTGEGPCLDGFHERRTVRLSGLSRDERWPEFIARAHGLGLAIPWT